MDPKKVFYSILEKSNKYDNLEFDKLKKSEQDEILLLLMKQVFFYTKNKFNPKKIKEKIQENDWISLFIGGIITTFLLEKDLGLIYGYVISYFYEDYDKIKANYSQFIKKMEKIKSKINFDLFEAAICFMCFLNGNNNFLEIISYLKKNDNIKNLELYNDSELTKKTLYQVITEYCILNNYPISLSEGDNKEGITKKGIINQMKLFRCYAEMCPINLEYKNFILSLYSCLKNCEDLRINREKQVAQFIEEIFILLKLHLKIPDYWTDSNILIITSDIYNAAFKYSTENFDENYIDFVISYITHYQIPANEFMYFFLKGLNEKEFNLIFKNCQLKEPIGSINDKETITKLLNKVYKRKMIGSKSLNNNKGKDTVDNENIKQKISSEPMEHQKQKNEIILINEIMEEKNGNAIKETKINNIENKKENPNDITNKGDNKDINSDIQMKNEEEISNSMKNTDNLTTEKKPKDPDYKALEEEFLNFRKEMDIYKAKNNEEKEHANKRLDEIESENKVIKEENKAMKDDISSLKIKNIKQDIEIKNLNNKIKRLTLELERISFRDLSKRVLNNMINYVKIKNGKLLEGLTKRKEKLNKINESFDFKDIEFMKKPIQEISYKYYHSNTRSHVPDVANTMKDIPFGLISDPAGVILNKYYQIMVDSKKEGVLNFLSNTLKIKNEINNLYL